MIDSLHYKLRACHMACQNNIISEIQKNTFLKSGEPKILEFLSEYEPCEQKAIATGCDLKSSSVAGLLSRMESRDLIKREMKAGNRRSLFVSRTSFGIEMTEKVEESFKRVDQYVLEELTSSEQEELIRLLDKVNGILKNMSE